MARNEEKHFGKLNRLYLMKEKEEYEKKNPTRPRLSSLCTPEEIQKWLPSIKRDIDFYLKKSQVTCYSDAHVEECREKVIKLEKEFRAFVRKIKQLSPSPLEAIPWTDRPYKRKKLDAELSEEKFSEKCISIFTPILDTESKNLNIEIPQHNYSWDLMNQPLSFSSKSLDCEKDSSENYVNVREQNSKISTFDSYSSNFSENDKKCQLSEDSNVKEINENVMKNISTEKDCHPKVLANVNIVNYDSSDENESS